MNAQTFFRADPDGGFTPLYPLGVNPATWSRPLYEGRLLEGSWRIPKVTLPREFLDRDVDEPILPLGDFAWLSVTVAASPRVQKLLERLVPDQVEFLELLPVDESVSGYRILNILNCINALDTDASEVQYVGSQVLHIWAYSWKHDIVGSLDIFRLSVQPGFIYVSARLKDLFEQAGARGLRFVPT